MDTTYCVDKSPSDEVPMCIPKQKDHMQALKIKDPVVHVRVPLIMETPK